MDRAGGGRQGQVMRLISFRAAGGEGFGAVVDTESTGAVVDLGARLGGRFPSLAAVLEAGALDEVMALAADAPPDFALAGLPLLPPVRGRNPVICVGRNYAEVGEQAGYETGAYPSIFQRRHAAQVGHETPIIRPSVSEKFDCEAELAVIIGRAGRHIAEADAYSHLAGYTILNEASVVDWMNHSGRNVTPGKNFDASGAMGPWMVTADEIDDPGNLHITHRLNGEIIQAGNTAGMIFPIPRIIAYLSTFTALVPGDVIATGTPGGVHARRKAGMFLQPGDVVEMEIAGIGVLRNAVTDQAAALP